VIKKNLAAPGSPSSALASIDPATGYIKAMASSSNYGDSKFNLAAQGRRQPGSTFKVMVMMAALRRGVDINKTSYVSKRLKFTHPVYGPIDVDNSDSATSGKSKTIFQGVVTSDNTVMQQADLDVGPKNVTRAAYDMGITTKLYSYPAEALGGLTTGVSPLEMARAYATINNGGSRVKPIAVTRVEFPGGRVDRKMGKVRKFKEFTDGVTYEAIQAMKGNVNDGTGTKARLNKCVAAGKTGTTSGFKDAWFAGMTRDVNTAVWVGYPGAEGRAMENVPGWGRMFGGTAPASIWKDFMTVAVKGTNCKDWPKPKTPFKARSFKAKLSKSPPPGSTSPTTQYPSQNYAPGIQPPSTSAPPPTDDGSGTGSDDGAGTDTGVQEEPAPPPPAAPSPPVRKPDEIYESPGDPGTIAPENDAGGAGAG